MHIYISIILYSKISNYNMLSLYNVTYMCMIFGLTNIG